MTCINVNKLTQISIWNMTCSWSTLMAEVVKNTKFFLCNRKKLTFRLHNIIHLCFFSIHISQTKNVIMRIPACPFLKALFQGTRYKNENNDNKKTRNLEKIIFCIFIIQNLNDCMWAVFFIQILDNSKKQFT